MAPRDKEQEDRIEEIGSGLMNPPTDVHQLLLLLDRAESILARVGQRPRQSTLTALRPSMEALISRKLLKHSDLDVRVAVTSCLSELTRITAPNAPYDDELMKEIFELIVGSFKKLDEFSSRSFLKRVSILETVAKVRSCVLMLDLECDDLISDMFHHFFNTIRPQHSYTVTSSMETIMTLVIEESENVSARLLSGLLAHLKIDDRASVQNVTPAARKLAEKVIVKCTSKLKPYMINWFRDASMLREYSKMVATVYHGNLGTIRRKEEDSTNIPEMKVVNSGKFKEESDKENSYRKFMDQGDFLTPEMKGRQKHKDLEQTNTEPRLKECEISVTEEKGNLVIKEIHQLEDLAFQKLPIDTTQMYGEKGMKLITPLEAEHSQISNLEEQLTSGKHQSTDLNNSLEQQYTVIHELNVKATDISMMNEKVACPFHSPELVEAEISTDKCSLAQELKTRQEKLLEEEAHRKSLEVKNKWMAEDRVAYDPDLSKGRGNAIRPSSGLELITNLSKLHKLREIVLRLKAMIAKILALQKSEELDVQTHEIETAADLALKDYNYLRFVEEGGLDTLLLLLEASKGETIQRLTAEVVANLAINGFRQDLIADKGGTRLLTSRAIQPDGPRTLWMVAWAIADLCGRERVRKGSKGSGGMKAPWPFIRDQEDISIASTMARATNERHRILFSNQNIEEVSIGGDTALKIPLSIEEIASHFNHVRKLYDSAFIISGECRQFFSIISKIIEEFKLLPRFCMVQRNSIISGHKGVLISMVKKLKDVELEKDMLSNQLHDHQKLILQLKSELENSGSTTAEQSPCHDMGKDELLSQVFYLRKEVLQLSSSSLVRERDTLRKELDKCKSKLKDTDCKLKNIFHEKVMLEGEKAQAERETKNLLDQRALLERDMLKRDSYLEKRREVKFLDQEELQGDYDKLEVLSLEMAAEISYFTEALKIAWDENDNAFVKNDTLTSDIEILTKKLNNAYSEMELIQEDHKKKEQMVADTESFSRRLENSLDWLPKETYPEFSLEDKLSFEEGGNDAGQHGYRSRRVSNRQWLNPLVQPLLEPAYLSNRS